MALPGPGTFGGLSAETPCYTFNWQNNIGEGRVVYYTDCNGVSGLVQSAPAGQSGNFCGRTATAGPGGGVGVNEAGSCPCKTWYTRLFNSADGRNYTFAWIDCNGQPARKNVVVEGFNEPTFYCCSKSKPVVIISGGPYNLDQRLEAQYCARQLVG
jgi:hypothetical protein